MKFKNYCLITVAAIGALAQSACKKEPFSPSIPEGTRFAKINIKGYTIETMKVRIGPRSILAGEFNEASSNASFEVPFAPGQNLNRVVFYNEDGTVPYATSQINFVNPAKDTTLSVFYDGKTFFKNPVFPVAPAGKMLFRTIFKSTASTYKGLVDLEFHLAKDGSGATPVIVNPAIAKVVKNVSQTTFSDYIDLPAFDDPGQYYVVYFRLPGTTNPLPYPTTNVTVDPYAVFYTTPAYTALITIRDTRITVDRPNKIIYLVEDKMPQF